MIKNLSSNSKFVQANGGTGSVPYINMSTPSAGMVRYNGSTQNMEIYDGISWLTLNSNYATVGLTIDAEHAIDWAKRQMEREARREQLIKENPALKKAYEAIKRAEDNFDILEKFVDNDNTSGIDTSPS